MTNRHNFHLPANTTKNYREFLQTAYPKLYESLQSHDIQIPASGNYLSHRQSYASQKANTNYKGQANSTQKTSSSLDQQLQKDAAIALNAATIAPPLSHTNNKEDVLPTQRSANVSNHRQIAPPTQNSNFLQPQQTLHSADPQPKMVTFKVHNVIVSHPYIAENYATNNTTTQSQTNNVPARNQETNKTEQCKLAIASTTSASELPLQKRTSKEVEQAAHKKISTTQQSASEISSQLPGQRSTVKNKFEQSIQQNHSNSISTHSNASINRTISHFHPYKKQQLSTATQLTSLPSDHKASVTESPTNNFDTPAAANAEKSITLLKSHERVPSITPEINNVSKIPLIPTSRPHPPLESTIAPGKPEKPEKTSTLPRKQNSKESTTYESTYRNCSTNNASNARNLKRINRLKYDRKRQIKAGPDFSDKFLDTIAQRYLLPHRLCNTISKNPATGKLTFQLPPNTIKGIDVVQCELPWQSPQKAEPGNASAYPDIAVIHLPGGKLLRTKVDQNLRSLLQRHWANPNNIGSVQQIPQQPTDKMNFVSANSSQLPQHLQTLGTNDPLYSHATTSMPKSTLDEKTLHMQMQQHHQPQFQPHAVISDNRRSEQQHTHAVPHVRDINNINYNVLTSKHPPQARVTSGSSQPYIPATHALQPQTLHTHAQFQSYGASDHQHSQLQPHVINSMSMITGDLPQHGASYSNKFANVVAQSETINATAPPSQAISKNEYAAVGQQLPHMPTLINYSYDATTSMPQTTTQLQAQTKENDQSKGSFNTTSYPNVFSTHSIVRTTFENDKSQLVAIDLSNTTELQPLDFSNKIIQL